jgi:hypothetical protein
MTPASKVGYPCGHPLYWGEGFLWIKCLYHLTGGGIAAPVPRDNLWTTMLPCG